jgi:small subunit ribosomal protein S11e
MPATDVFKEAEQTEKAYQKQDAVFIGRKRVLGKKTKKGMRFTRNIGLGFKTPKEAIEGSYVDKKCPFTGGVSIRGRILKGLVISSKMKNTLIIRRDYLRWVGKYRRCVARASRGVERTAPHPLPFAPFARRSCVARGARERARACARVLERRR